jgi:hypothetical protein
LGGKRRDKKKWSFRNLRKPREKKIGASAICGSHGEKKMELPQFAEVTVKKKLELPQFAEVTVKKKWSFRNLRKSR